VYVVHAGKNVNAIAWFLVRGGFFFRKRDKEVLVNEIIRKFGIS
jgi:hypothetical protein